MSLWLQVLGNRMRKTRKVRSRKMMSKSFVRVWFWLSKLKKMSFTRL